MSESGKESKTGVILLIVGIVLVGALIGIFFPIGVKKVNTPMIQTNSTGEIAGQNVNPIENRETDAYYIKADIDQAVCGIKIFSPLPGQKVSFPLEVSGYVNGCEWNPFEQQVATVELRDMNSAISKKIAIPVEDENNYTLPAYFKIKITPDTNPTSGNGVLIFQNNPTNQQKQTFQVPVAF